jgi:hypothetical protein
LSIHRKLLKAIGALGLISLLPVLAMAQGNTYQPQLITGNGAPGTGAFQTCAIYQEYIDVSTGNKWHCLPDNSGQHGSWVANLNPSSLNSIIFVDGVTYPLNSTGLTNACTAAGASGTVGISKPIVMTANVTCSSAIQFFAGGTITTTGWTLTLNGTIFSPDVQILLGTGSIVLGSNGAGPIMATWFPGSDCGARINTADVATGNTPREIWVDQACGSVWTTAVVIGASAHNYHTLRFIQGGTYTTSAGISSASVGGTILGVAQSIAGGSGIKAGPTVLQAANGSNLAALVSVNGVAELSVRDLILDGNKSNNPTGGVCLLVTGGAFRYDSESVVYQNCSTHGAWLNSSCCASFRSSFFGNNSIDGIFANASADIFVGEATQFNIQGIAPTVNTTSTTITATSGSWSTDSSLVGTTVRVNNAFNCTVAAIPSTTTITIGQCWNYPAGTAATLSTLTGVSMAWGDNIELVNSPTMRINHADIAQAQMDGIFARGTSGGSANLINEEMIGPAIEMGNYQNDIEIVGYDTVGAATTSILNNIQGITFIGDTNRTNNIYSSIKMVDGGLSNISGLSCGAGPVGHLSKACLEFTETAGGRMTANQVSANMINSAAFGTAGIIDSTANGATGLQIAVHGGGSSGATLDLFDQTAAAANPHKFFRVAGGTLQIVNSSFGAVIQQLTDSGNLMPVVIAANQGTALSNGAISLGTGWGTGASAAVCTGPGWTNTGCFTITSGSASFSAAPTVTVTLPNTIPSASTPCTLDVHAITGAGGAIIFDETTYSFSAPVFTATTSTGAAFTPAVTETYKVVLRCGP